MPELDGTPVTGVTVRELLGHLSGMTPDGDDSSFWSLDRRYPDREELLDPIREHGKVLEPNERFKYSNIDYWLLGLISEAASGVSWREYVQDSIVDRLGLEHTGPDLDAARLGEFAKGYSSRVVGPERGEIEHIDTFAESSATGVFSNASDVTAYFQAHLDGDERLISEVKRRTCYGHGGNYPGHITMSKLDLERKLSIWVFTNSSDGWAEKLTRTILHLIDLALDARDEAKPAADLEGFAGRLADLRGLTDVVNLGGRPWVLDPALDNPPAEAFAMEIVSGTELRMVGEKGFRGYGEVMRYHVNDDGAVEWVRGASGHRLIPAERFALPAKVNRPS